MVRKPSLEKRARFLSSALKLFAANGVQSTSTAAIAKEADTAAGTLFLYFPTKQDLIHALVLKITREQSETINSLLEANLSAQETFFVIWEGTIRWFMDNKEAYRYIQQVRDSGIIANEITQETSRYLSYYFDAIHKGLAESAIHPYPIELIGEILYRDIVAVLNLTMLQSDSAKNEEYIRLGFDIFWNGIKTSHG